MALLALLALLAVAVMGFAIQRGGTCTVAAVDEWISQRRLRRLAALLEAALWVAGSLALAHGLLGTGSLPPDHAADAWTVIGGALLGLGAWLNGACVFGTVARLGSGQWAYAFTPLGFFIGCLAAGRLPARTPLPAPDTALLRGAALLAPLFLLFALLRITPALRAARWRQAVWAPHAATIVIGLTFVVTWLAAGRWAYTDVLADLANAMRQGQVQLGLPLLLLLALLGGALLGGRTAGAWQPVRPTPRRILQCGAGGALMGCGSLLIPGSNDGLILIGLPLLRPHAVLALATMVLVIAAALLLQRRHAAA